MRSAGMALPGVEIAILDRRRQSPAAAPDRRDRHALRLQHERLLEQARRDRRTLRRRRLAAHRRCRLHGRGRLSLYPRPHQGHDHLRRRERLSGRSRERDLRSSGRRRSRRDRRARRQMGRSGEGGRRDEAGQQATATDIIDFPANASPTSRRRRASTFSRRCRAAPPARFCAANCAIRIGRARIAGELSHLRRSTAIVVAAKPGPIRRVAVIGKMLVTFVRCLKPRPVVMGPCVRRDDVVRVARATPQCFPAPIYPNRNPATLRFWISSLPSVMR